MGKDSQFRPLTLLGAEERWLQTLPLQRDPGQYPEDLIAGPPSEAKISPNEVIWARYDR